MPKSIQTITEMLSNVEKGTVFPLSISTPHPLYDDNKDTWKKCRDAVEGQDAIKKGGVTYLPQMNGQEKKEYLNYLHRAQWFDATRRTRNGYMGMIYRKSPQVFYGSDVDKDKVPDPKFWDHISSEGKSLTAFIKSATKEIIDVGRVGVLVEFPDNREIAESAVSMYDYEQKIKQKDLHPIFSLYKTEDIINWHWEYFGSTLVPVLFVLRETTYNGYQTGTISPTKSEIYRVLYLEPYEGGFRYKQIKFEPMVAGSPISKGKVQEVIYPRMNGKYIPFIPFFTFDEEGNIDYKDIGKPIINGLVDVNIGHYVNSADRENEIHMVGHKTAVFPGWDKKVYGNPRWGGALAVPKGCDPKLLEASSDSGLVTAMKDKVEQMAVLGTEILTSGGYVASVDTARTSSATESAPLTLLVKSLSHSFTVISRFLVQWAGYEDTGINIQINTDFFQDDIKSDELLGWMKAYQQGGISWETYFYNLKKKEVYPDKVDGDTEKQQIQDSLNEQFDVAGEKYLEIMDAISQLKEDVQATITTSSSGQTLLSMSTGSGGSNISTSTEVSDSSMEGAEGRNNETPGQNNASAKDDKDKSKVDEKKDPTVDRTDNKEK